MPSLNHITIVGNLGHDPELKHTPKGTPLTALSIATTRGYKQPDGSYLNSTDWHRAVVWGKRAEKMAERLKKGNRVFVQGSVQTRTWKDRSGVEHKTSEIMVDDISFLGVSGTAASVSAEATV